MSQSEKLHNLADYQRQSSPSAVGAGPGKHSLKHDDGDGTFDDMDKERLAKLEGGFDGLKGNQAVLMTAVGLVSAILIALGVFAVGQLSALNAKYSELPGKISADLREMNSTLLQAVTATRQAPPQVILLPAPTEKRDAPAASDGDAQGQKPR